MPMDNISLAIKINLKNLLVRLAEKQPDERQRPFGKFNTLIAFVSKISEKDLIADVNLLKEITQFAEKGVVDKNWHMRSAAFYLFKAYLQTIKHLKKLPKLE